MSETSCEQKTDILSPCKVDMKHAAVRVLKVNQTVTVSQPQALQSPGELQGWLTVLIN